MCEREERAETRRGSANRRRRMVSEVVFSFFILCGIGGNFEKEVYKVGDLIKLNPKRYGLLQWICSIIKLKSLF